MDIANMIDYRHLANLKDRVDKLRHFIKVVSKKTNRKKPANKLIN